MKHASSSRYRLTDGWCALARLVASGVATTVGFDVEEVEDLRIAVDELCTALVEGGDGGALLLGFDLGDSEVSILGTTSANRGRRFRARAARSAVRSWPSSSTTTTCTPITDRSVSACTRDEATSTAMHDPTPRQERARESEPEERTEDRFRRWRATGDRNVRNTLIEEHRWVAIHCARRFADRGVPLDDLIQVGQLGLLKAVERFDPDIGVSFASYAIPTVMGELRRHFRDATWALKVPRRVKDLHVDLGNAVDFLSGERGRPPTPADLAEHLGVRVEDILEALEAGGAYRAGPLTAPTDDDDSPRDGAALRDEDMVLAGADDRMLVRQLLSTLPDRERSIIELRFYAGLSQSEIAEQVGVSQVHVSRLLRSSLAALQRAAGDERS